MATTTPNYGWPVPTSTDLVKDGAVAIESLGDAADATMATMVPKSIVDAKGDIIAATAADTVTRLALGTNGQVLTVDTSTATGLKYATPAAGGGGKILQVVQATNSTATTSTSTSFSDSSLSATITPSSASSKILVITSQMMRIVRASTGMELNWQLVRGSTAILTYDYATLNGILSINVAANTSGNLALNCIVPMTYLDSPATTSATTYKTQIGASFTSSSGSVTAQFGGLTSTMILMEVGA